MQGRFSLFPQLKKLCNTITSRKIPNQTQCHVFITHRGPDTKRNIAVLLHDNLRERYIYSFLDYKTMKPGDKISESIDSAIRECTIGVVLFSPGYCDSSYCLQELALLVEMKKKLIPIFCDVNVDQLQIIDDGAAYHSSDVERFRHALAQAKDTAGIEFNTLQGDWQKLIQGVSDSVITNLPDVQKSDDYTSSRFGVRPVNSVLRYIVGSLITFPLVIIFLMITGS